jgi:predicted SAM-dependent methyltransferase
MKKLHIGCGAVYLEGWTNIDMPGPDTHLAKDRPDLVERLKTTEKEGYYARHQDKTISALREGPIKKEMVCDEFGTFQSLPASAQEIEEILARHVFEHLSLTEARKALDEVDYRMAPGGVLRIDVPDHEETLKLYKSTGDAFYIRHLLGPRSNEYGYHMMSYTRDLLKKTVEEHGFIFEAEEPNIHFYPAFCYRFRKPGIRPPYEYFADRIKLEPSWVVGEIGPGTYPLPYAAYYIDKEKKFLEAVSSRAGVKTILGDVEQGLPIPDKFFDFIYASHILEHVNNLEKACKEVSRIAKRGVVIVPSAFKDFMFNWEEGDHKWWFLPNYQNVLEAKRLDYEFRSVTSDSNYSRATCHLFRTGPNRVDPEYRLLRRWFYEKEPALDVFCAWEGEIKLKVIA